jgi:hypothetical protein
MQRESRGRWSTTTETFAVYPCSSDIPQAQQPGEWIGLIGLVLWVERRGARGRMASRGRVWTIPEGFIPRRWTRCSWFQTSGIGQRGGAFWTALWAVSIGAVDGIGGATLRSKMTHF